MPSAQTPPTTKPCPSDQSRPIGSPAPLSSLAIAQGIPADLVGAYEAHRQAFLSAPYRLVATVVELAQVQS